MSTFWPFWPIPGHPLECKVLKKSLTCPQGLSSETTWSYFDQFFSKIPCSQTILSSIFEKGGGFPRWTIRLGENRHFFPGFGERVVWVSGIFPGSCFLEGGAPL